MEFPLWLNRSRLWFPQIKIKKAGNNESVVFLEHIFVVYFTPQLHDLVKIAAFNTEVFSERISQNRTESVLVKNIFTHIFSESAEQFIINGNIQSVFLNGQLEPQHIT